MRVLLINPFYPISETPSPPLGLAYLASALSEAGFEVKILDLVVYPYSQAMLQNVLEQVQPQLVGLTAVTMSLARASTLCMAECRDDSVSSERISKKEDSRPTAIAIPLWSALRPPRLRLRHLLCRSLACRSGSPSFF